MTKPYGMKRHEFEDGVCECGTSYYTGKYGNRQSCPICCELNRRSSHLISVIRKNLNNLTVY